MFCLSDSSRSRSLIEPVQEEDESSLLDEIDELARKRDSSPAPPSMRDPVKIVRQMWVSTRFWGFFYFPHCPVNYLNHPKKVFPLYNFKERSGLITGDLYPLIKSKFKAPVNIFQPWGRSVLFVAKYWLVSLFHQVTKLQNINVCYRRVSRIMNEWDLYYASNILKHVETQA